MTTLANNLVLSDSEHKTENSSYAAFIGIQELLLGVNKETWFGNLVTICSLASSSGGAIAARYVLIPIWQSFFFRSGCWHGDLTTS